MGGRMRTKRKPGRVVHIYHYSLIDEMMASPTEPLPAAWRRHQLTRMWNGLRAIETAPEPTVDDWQVCSDALNLMETLVVDMGVAEDADGLLHDGMAALAHAGNRRVEGKPIRLDARGIIAVRSLLENYAELIDALPARAMIRAHRLTERRIHDILQGKMTERDVRIKSANAAPKP